MKNNKTRALVEGAIFASITIMIGILITYIPFLFFLSYIWPVPTIIISYRHGFKLGFLSGLTATLILIMLQGPISGVIVFLLLFVPGTFLGYFMKTFKKQQNLILASTIVLIVCATLSLVLAGVLSGVNPMTMLDNALRVYVAQSDAATKSMMKTYVAMGISADKITQLPTGEDLMLFLKKGIYVTLFIAGIFTTILNLWITNKILARMKIETPKVEPLSHWHLSIRGLVVVSASIFFILVSMYFFNTNTLLMDITTTMTYCLVIWFWFLGLATVSFFINKLSMPTAMKVIIIVVTAMPLIKAYAIAGYIEAAIDLRKLRPEIIRK